MDACLMTENKKDKEKAGIVTDPIVGEAKEDKVE